MRIMNLLAGILATSNSVNYRDLVDMNKQAGRQRIASRTAYHTPGSRKRRAARRFAQVHGRRMRRGR